MRKWVIAAVVLVLVGGGLTAWQVHQKGQELAAQAAAQKEADAKAAEEAARKAAELAAAPDPLAPAASTTAAGFPPLVVPENIFAGGSVPRPLPLAAIAAQQKLRREGLRMVEVSGTIDRQPGQTVFVPADNSAPLILLANQLLERVDYLLDRGGLGPKTRWVVSGMVTEYHGANYLLLDRVVVE